MQNFSKAYGILPQTSEQVKPKVNLFDFSQKSTVQPQATNFVQNIKPVVKQPIQQPTPKSGFSIVPQASADNWSNWNIIQTFLDDSKNKPELDSRRKAVIQMLQNQEDESFIQDTIVNKMWYKWTTQPVQQPQEQKSIISNWFDSTLPWQMYNVAQWVKEHLPWAIEKIGETFMWWLKRVWEAGDILKKDKFAVWEAWLTAIAWIWQSIFSPITWAVWEAVQTWVEQIPQWVKDDIGKKVQPTIEGVKTWYNSQSTLQKKNLKGLWLSIETLSNFYWWKVATPVVQKTWKEIVNLWKWIINTPKTIKNSINQSFQKTAEQISTKANRFRAWINWNPTQKFIDITWETPWEFAVRRWLTTVWDDALIEWNNFYRLSLKEADNAFDAIPDKITSWVNKEWKDVLTPIINDLDKRLSYVDSPDMNKIKEYKAKLDSWEWLTMSEINDTKRVYSKNFKYTFANNVWEDAIRSSNLQNNLRKWQFEKAKEFWLTNIDEINKNTQAWRMFTDELWKSLKRSSWNNAIWLTDWIALSWWNPTNIAMFLWKKAVQSNIIKNKFIKTFWKTTKNPIIKASNLTSNWKTYVTNNGVLRNMSTSSNKPVLALPEWKKPAIITPHTIEKWVILESKKWLEKTKFGINKNNPEAFNYKLSKQIISETNKPTWWKYGKSWFVNPWAIWKDIKRFWKAIKDWGNKTSYVPNKRASIWITKPDDLINEAKKYKSANEFVNEQRRLRVKWQRWWSAPWRWDINLVNALKWKHNQPKDIFDITRIDAPELIKTKEAIKEASKTWEITIYRAVPKNINNFRDWEWVYFNKDMANLHWTNALDWDYKILSKKVKNNEVYWDWNDINEWGYDTWAWEKQLRLVYEEAKKQWLKIPEVKNIDNDLQVLKAEARRLENESEWGELWKVQKKIFDLENNQSNTITKPTWWKLWWLKQIYEQAHKSPIKKPRKL